MFCIVFSIQSFSQDIINSYANQSGTWSDYRNTWIWNPMNYVKISFLVQNNVVIAGDDAKSTYTTYRVSFEDGGSVCWDAIDEQGRNCMVMLSQVEDINCLIIIYSDKCFRYYY
jgi:hypothetical protein